MRVISRRKFPRVPGPFDGRRAGLLPVPLRIHDLSAGGCLIEAHHEETLGRRVGLEIELPYEGWIAIDAMTIYLRPDYGFAVRFVDVDAVTQERLDRVIERLLPKKADPE